MKRWNCKFWLTATAVTSYKLRQLTGEVVTKGRSTLVQDRPVTWLVLVLGHGTPESLGPRGKRRIRRLPRGRIRYVVYDTSYTILVPKLYDTISYSRYNRVNARFALSSTVRNGITVFVEPKKAGNPVPIWTQDSGIPIDVRVLPELPRQFVTSTLKVCRVHTNLCCISMPRATLPIAPWSVGSSSVLSIIISLAIPVEFC